MNANCSFVEYSLFFRKEKTLVIADLHLGHEEALQLKGVLVPKFQYGSIEKRLKDLLESTKATHIIINGDLKHEFGKILNTEWREIIRLLEFLKANNCKITVIGGNHDQILLPILKRYDVPLVSRFQLGQYLMIHGDETEQDIPPDVTTLVMGHEHPCIGLRSGARVEKYKCFLVGKYKQYTLLVLPSFTQLTLGTDILANEVLSPYLKQGLDNFEVYIPEENGTTRYFGKVKDLYRLNNEAM